MVCLVDLVYPVGFVHRVSLVQPNTQYRPDRPNRPNEQDRLTDFFGILVAAGANLNAPAEASAVFPLSQPWRQGKDVET
ncbi:MAG: hypothetical protein EWM73_03455 [Nitrospira sp.]|nr:MAG: hypothetical protein EWM73_03455 [Nitrospira sp.]